MRLPLCVEYGALQQHASPPLWCLLQGFSTRVKNVVQHCFGDSATLWMSYSITLLALVVVLILFFLAVSSSSIVKVRNESKRGNLCIMSEDILHCSPQVCYMKL